MALRSEFIGPSCIKVPFLFIVRIGTQGHKVFNELTPHCFDCQPSKKKDLTYIINFLQLYNDFELCTLVLALGADCSCQSQILPKTCILKMYKYLPITRVCRIVKSVG